MLNHDLEIMRLTSYLCSTPQYILKNDSLLLNKNPKWTPSIRKNTPFIRVFMWFFGGFYPRLLVFTFFFITFFLLPDSILFFESFFHLIFFVNVRTNKIRKSSEKITENNYHSIIFIIFCSGGRTRTYDSLMRSSSLWDWWDTNFSTPRY